jgi:peptidoglycan hydrolase-like protein with peptidoglycan-binding domain
VQQGSSGSAVKALQSQLTAHGIGTTVDGIFGPNTGTNLKTYQTGVGLAATGAADATTWKYLVA